MLNLVEERPDGTKVEYRRRPSPHGLLRMESRVLRPDGTPYPDGWYPVSDAQLLQLQRDGSDIVAMLTAEKIAADATL